MRRTLARLADSGCCLKDSFRDTFPDSAPGPGPDAARQQQHVPRHEPQATNAPIENLPPEVRRHILSLADFEDLQTLVRASPVFHQQYLLDHNHLLYGCLERTLGAVAGDALAVYRSSPVEFAASRTPGGVGEFLSSYQDDRLSRRFPSATTPAEAVGMLAFHASVIKPLSQSCAAWAMAILASEAGRPVSSPLGEPHLSRTEERRMVRALYRFQLCCNLLGAGEHCPALGRQRLSLTRRPVGILLKVFFRMMEPWEEEAVAFIYCFAWRMNKLAYEDVLQDLKVNKEAYKGLRPEIYGLDGVNFDKECVKNDFIEGTASCGLRLLHTMLYKVRSHKDIVSLMRERMIDPPGDFIRWALKPPHQSKSSLEMWRRVRSIPTRVEEVGDLCQLRFRGNEEEKTQVMEEKYVEGKEKGGEVRREDTKLEVEEKAEDEDEDEREENGVRPPLAWSTICTASRAGRGYHKYDTMRNWGPAIWDVERLERTGGKELLLR